jgi:hypothetical protein
MKRIHYASGSLLTGDDIADVLVRYAAALAETGSAADVHAPAVVAGERGEVVMLLGPASQILAENEPWDGEELEDPAFVARIEQSILAIGPRRATFVENGTDDVSGVDLDLL